MSENATSQLTESRQVHAWSSRSAHTYPPFAHRGSFCKRRPSRAGVCEFEIVSTVNVRVRRHLPPCWWRFNMIYGDLLIKIVVINNWLEFLINSLKVLDIASIINGALNTIMTWYIYIYRRSRCDCSRKSHTIRLVLKEPLLVERLYINISCSFSTWLKHELWRSA